MSKIYRRTHMGGTPTEVTEVVTDATTSAAEAVTEETPATETTEAVATEEAPAS